MGRFAPHPARRPALVTGASSGIGAATARVLAGAGHPVALAARRRDRLEELADELRRHGAEAVVLPCDLAQAPERAALLDQAEAELGPLEILVANAGGNAPGGVLDTEPGDFAALVALNLLAVQDLVHTLGAAMAARGRGDLVFVTSDVVPRPRPHMAAYVSAKWGLEGMARALQLELEGTGVRASVVRPGPTLTAMGMDWDPEVTGQVLEAWARFGFARHDHFLPPASVAAAVAAVVTAPPGTHLALVEVQPEAPPSHPPKEAP
jgi:short-subunit dehydrogenase